MLASIYHTWILWVTPTVLGCLPSALTASHLDSPRSTITARIPRLLLLGSSCFILFRSYVPSTIINPNIARLKSWFWRFSVDKTHGALAHHVLLGEFHLNDFDLSGRCREVNQLASTKLSRWVCSRKLREVLTTWEIPGNSMKTRDVHSSLGELALVYGKYITWLVIGPPLWTIWKSIGMIRNPIFLGK